MRRTTCRSRVESTTKPVWRGSAAGPVRSATTSTGLAAGTASVLPSYATAGMPNRPETLRDPTVAPPARRSSLTSVDLPAGTVTNRSVCPCQEAPLPPTVTPGVAPTAWAVAGSRSPRSAAAAVPRIARVVIVTSVSSPSPAYPAEDGGHHAEAICSPFAGAFCQTLPVDNSQEMGASGRLPRASPADRGQTTSFASFERETDMFSNLKMSAGLGLVVIAAAAGLGACAVTTSNAVDTGSAGGVGQATIARSE